METIIVKTIFFFQTSRKNQSYRVFSNSTQIHGIHPSNEVTPIGEKETEKTKTVDDGVGDSSKAMHRKILFNNKPPCSYPPSRLHRRFRSIRNIHSAILRHRFACHIVTELSALHCLLV
jgi:hypothetical protein